MHETTTQASRGVAEGDYPALYLAADNASRLAQKRHLHFTAVILSGLVLSAAMGTFAGIFHPVGKLLALASGAGAAISFIVTSIRKAMRPDRLWYSGRAVAESAKSMAWLYMTGAEPYLISMPAAEVDSKFIADLKALAKDQAQTALGLGGEFSERPQITARMRELRSASLSERKQTYLAWRIADQRKWYAHKSEKSQRVANRYFVVIQVSQALTLAATVLLLSPMGAQWNLGGIFSSLASALIAWLQVRQHEELAQAYSVTALDLGFVEEEGSSVATEKDLSAFVGDAENTLGREHSLWIARKTSA
jgi:hypothetical protein